jgi:hypothetical protein
MLVDGWANNDVNQKHTVFIQFEGNNNQNCETHYKDEGLLEQVSKFSQNLS